MSDKCVLVTGANGFVGQALVKHLLVTGKRVVATVRSSGAEGLPATTDSCEIRETGEIDGKTEWRRILADVDCIVHLASRVHVMNDTASNPLAEFRRINVDGSCRLAEMAARMKVRRFVFLSSIKVLGEKTIDRPFCEDDTPCPVEPYGISKCEAESALRTIAVQSDLELVILRPPLVYGPGVKGNILRLLQFIARGLPLPVKGISNQRSMLALRNLVEAIAASIDSASAAGEVFHVTDRHDLSVAELVQGLAAGLGRSPRLFPMPEKVLRVLLCIIGKEGLAGRLLDNLQMDSSKICAVLDWSPPVSPAESLREVGEWYTQSGEMNKRYR